jgi:hypothetical protein
VVRRTYTLLTNICVVAAILSAVFFDLFKSSGSALLFGGIGALAALVAMFVYWRHTRNDSAADRPAAAPPSVADKPEATTTQAMTSHLSAPIRRHIEVAEQPTEWILSFKDSISVKEGVPILASQQGFVFVVPNVIEVITSATVEPTYDAILKGWLASAPNHSSWDLILSGSTGKIRARESTRATYVPRSRSLARVS